MRKRNPEERKRAMKRYRQKHKEKIAKYARAYQLRRPEVYRLSTIKAYHKNKFVRLAKKWGIKVEDILDLPNECEICGTAENLRIDHCHTTNTLRGKLCDSCNKGLGSFRDSLFRLEKAIEYVLKHQRRTA